MLLEFGAKRRNVRGAAWAPGAEEIVITRPDDIRVFIFDQNSKFGGQCISLFISHVITYHEEGLT